MISKEAFCLSFLNLQFGESAPAISLYHRLAPVNIKGKFRFGKPLEAVSISIDLNKSKGYKQRRADRLSAGTRKIGGNPQTVFL
jgi:hypothetical protein